MTTVTAARPFYVPLNGHRKTMACASLAAMSFTDIPLTERLTRSQINELTTGRMPTGIAPDSPEGRHYARVIEATERACPAQDFTDAQAAVIANMLRTTRRHSA